MYYFYFIPFISAALCAGASFTKAISYISNSKLNDGFAWLTLALVAVFVSAIAYQQADLTVSCFAAIGAESKF